jgi:hypothetical protein
VAGNAHMARKANAYAEPLGLPSRNCLLDPDGDAADISQAINSTEKSFRPSHRASLNGTILHDASYIGTIEVVGQISHLKLLLSHCCDPQIATPDAIR